MLVCMLQQDMDVLYAFKSISRDESDRCMNGEIDTE